MEESLAVSGERTQAGVFEWSRAVRLLNTEAKVSLRQIYSLRNVTLR